MSAQDPFLVEPPKDERLGLPSASSMERIMECPGSFQMERKLRETGNRYAADRGTRIHAALANEIPMSALRHSERICAERIAFEEGRLVEHYGMEGAQQTREKRLWLQLNGRKACSGKPDVIYWDPANLALLVINFKTGFYLPTPIEENWQMKCEGALAASSHNFLLDKITIALVHPNAPLLTKEGSVISQAVTLTREECRENAAALSRCATEAVSPNAKRMPGKECCRFCLGAKQMVCPEYLATLRP